MHTLFIEEKNKTIQIADCWDELNPDQLAFVFQHALLVTEGKLDYTQFCILVFKYLTGLQIGAQYVAKEKLNLNTKINEQIYMLATSLCGWAFYESDKGLELDYNSFANPFRTIKLSKSIELYGPADLIGDLIFKEFRYAIDQKDYYVAAIKESNFDEAEMHLNYFIACLYRRKDGKKRKPLNTDDLDALAKDVEGIPMWQKQWILTWFSFCISYIKTVPFDIEGAEVELELLFPESEVESIKGLGWSGILIDITKSQVFGTLEQCDNYSLFRVLLFWYKTHLENLKEKARNQ
ncbi:hypothetical protein [Sphingobacterium sp. HSC-15S19]|uniref:hypothetical protein n=1 Tax=Sphingobacterium sp. HSC-15S19 TaxID=2910971 RepID=UPI003D25D774